MRPTYLLWLLWLLAGTGLQAQTGLPPGPSPQPADTLTLDSFYAQVLRHHPVAVQANLLPEVAEAQLRQARGAFDPVLMAEQGEKRYTDQLYYDKRSAGVKIPIAGWVDVSAGVDRNVGPFINPENSTSGGALTYVGIEVSVLRGLLLDERRAVLRQARLLPALSEADRAKVLNKLLLDAGKAYWNWWLAWRQYELLREGLGLAEFRASGVEAGVANGDRAAIDTAEASLEVLRRRVSLTEGEALYRNTRLLLSNYLWREGFAYDSLPVTTVPPLLPAGTRNPAVDSLVDAAITHPDVLAQELKQQQLDIDRRLARWNLLPDLRLEAKPYLYAKDVSIPWDENYRWGARLYFPLFLRKERGKLQEATLKLEQGAAELENIRRTRVNEVLQRDVEWVAFARQVEAQRAALARSEQLLTGENEMFRNGESSLFLVNQRERAVLDARLKLSELLAKRQQLALERLAAAGILPRAADAPPL